MALLEAGGLVKRFGGVTATDGVSVLAEGEIRGLIGPNGSGKTTLANLLTGLYRPDAGSIRLDGASILGLPPHRVARAGLLRTFQVGRLFGSLSVRENLLLPLFVRPAKGAGQGQHRIDALLALTGLDAVADLPAKALSGGQRALLQVACGFMAPALKAYVLDEPFAGINPVVKDAIIELILRQNREHGTAFLVVSHEMAVIRRLCSKVTVLIAGRVQAEGTLDQVASRADVVEAYLGKSFA